MGGKSGIGSFKYSLTNLAPGLLQAVDVEILQDIILDEEGLTLASGSQTKFSNNVNNRTFERH